MPANGHVIGVASFICVWRKLSVDRLHSPQPASADCLGVIWSSLTGN